MLALHYSTPSSKCASCDFRKIVDAVFARQTCEKYANSTDRVVNQLNKDSARIRYKRICEELDVAWVFVLKNLSMGQASKEANQSTPVDHEAPAGEHL
jgi:hypothetical protein